MFSVKSISTSWNKIFFEPQSVDSLAMFRIVWGLLLFSNMLTYFPAINDFYGPHAITSLDTVRNEFNFFHVNIFYLFPLTNQVIEVALYIYGASILGVIFGFYTRFSLVVSTILLMSFHQRNIWLLGGSEIIMRVTCLYLVFSPCGNSLSVDAWIASRFKKKALPQMVAPWALRLIQIQLSVIYVWTIWNKLKGNLWFEGTAVYYATRLESFTNYPVDFLLNTKWMLSLLTWGTLVIEFLLGTFIWFKEFRKPLIIAGIIFHLGIDYTMSIPFFEYVMITLLMTHLTPTEVRVYVEKGKNVISEFKNFIEKKIAEARGLYE